MPDVLQHIHGTPVLVCSAEGSPLRGSGDVLDVIGEAMHHGARWVAVPAERLDDDFFRLRTGVAGEILQKFVNYRLGLAVIGDISAHTAIGSALRDLVRESNQAGQAWFLPSLADLHDRLRDALACP